MTTPAPQPSAPLVGFRNVVPVIGCTFMEGTTENGEQTIIVVQETPDRVPGFPSEGVTKEVLEGEDFIPRLSRVHPAFGSFA